jgi:prepilin-type N-terminal cleavage/methylation domain-containing protein
MKHGFTLIEMMVSLAVIALVSVLFIANFHSANKRTDLILAAQTLVSDLHAAQNNSLGLTKYNGTVPPGGWGISLATSSNSYTLFADVDGNMQYSTSTEGNVLYGARVTTLPANISISQLQTSLASSTPAVNVTFLPPDPQTNIYDVNSGATSTLLTITMKESLNNTTKTVQVNFLGLVEVTN